jgi:hypothetical protein
MSIFIYEYERFSFEKESMGRIYPSAWGRNDLASIAVKIKEHDDNGVRRWQASVLVKEEGER